MRRAAIRGFLGITLGLAAAWGLPTAAAAQNVCSGQFDTLLSGPAFGIEGSVYSVTLKLGAGTISGADPQFLDINRLRYELDCANNAFVGCVDEGDIIAFDGNISTLNCTDSVGGSVSWSVATHTPPGDPTPNTVVFTPSAPVRIAEGASPLDANACQITFDVVVNQSPGLDLTPLVVQMAAGYSQADMDGVCTNGLAAGSQSTLSIDLCQTTCSEQDTDCESFACDPGTGECVGTPEPASTSCDDVADTEECANPGCDGAGNCVANHIPEPDSTPCTDTGLGCWIAGCAAGVCEQMHLPEAASTPCTDVPDTEECANPGCDGAGTCSPTHIAEPDSTACTDTGLDCWIAGCEAGVCVQEHTPEAASTACDDVADTEECANPGCDGAGTCSPTHLPEPDSTPCTDTGLGCWIAGCAAGVCEQMHLPEAASTPCTDVPDTEECANPGCDGAGTCSPTHIAEPDSTPCTDTGLGCWLAGCAAGVCEQMHLPEAASTPCDDVADTEECANPGCDGAGTCSPTHIAEPDSTACTDTDGNPCSVAGCEAGACVQVHLCEPDGKADCEITIGDFIWNDGNADGLQDAEPGIPDVDLNLVECSSGEVVETTTTTDANGAYLFTVSAVTDLETCAPESREFLVQVDSSNFASGGALEGLNGSPPDVGADDSVDSDCDPTSNQTMCTAFPAGTNDLTIDCGYTPPPGGCLTRTPGFWCTHPTVTALFLPVMSCGIDLTNVMVETAGSAIEDLNYGNDFKDASTSPQQLQLIRQCAAAALNIAASEANEGSCEGATLTSGDTIAEVFDSCCGEDLCDSDASASEITGSGCIELLDEFNNSLDTFGSCVAGLCEGTLTACISDDDCSPEPFDNLGSSMCPIPDGDTPTLTDSCGGQPGRCSAANGNGFVNPGRDLGPGQSTGGPPPGKGPKKK